MQKKTFLHVNSYHLCGKETMGSFKIQNTVTCLTKGLLYDRV